MSMIVDELTTHDGRHFINGIGKGVATIKNGNFGVGFIEPFAIEINYARQGAFLWIAGFMIVGF